MMITLGQLSQDTWYHFVIKKKKEYSEDKIFKNCHTDSDSKIRDNTNDNLLGIQEIHFEFHFLYFQHLVMHELEYCFPDIHSYRTVAHLAVY